MSTGREYALTSDGEAEKQYASIITNDSIQAIWSPDSKFTHQFDVKKVISRPYIEYYSKCDDIAPRLKNKKMAYPGDDHVETYRLIVFDVDTGRAYTSTTMCRHGTVNSTVFSLMKN